MIYVISWYVIVTLLGWLAFPLSFRMLSALPDRGYTASRALGLLLWGYLFWIFASFGFLRNNSGGLFFALALLAVLSILVLRHNHLMELLDWIRSRRGLILVVELTFLLAFVGWNLVRAANPEAVGTEKPMELAFINAILASPTFPPHDPWLSGYSISYYYFGYVLVSLLAKLSATPGGIAFNLGITLVFSLSAVGAYGLVYNLVAPSRQARDSDERSLSIVASLAGFLGPLFVLLVSNLEGFLHLLHTNGILWLRDQSGNLTSTFWRWLDIKDLNQPPTEPFNLFPSRFWWWWRASRVLQDYDLAGNAKEIIDEFPFFSYLLADLHPHVLAMPFAFLGIALALNVFLGGFQGRMSWLPLQVNSRKLAWLAYIGGLAGILLSGFGISRLTGMLLWLSSNRVQVNESLSSLMQPLTSTLMGMVLLILSGLILYHARSNPKEALPIGIKLHISSPGFLLSSTILGSMAFLNTWDFPLYVGLFSAAYALHCVLTEQKRLSAGFRDFIWMGFALGLVGVLMYLPFYIGFSSQVGGILPNLIYPTRGAHLWVMFAPLLIPIIIFLIVTLYRFDARRLLIWQSFLLALGLLAALLLCATLLGLAIVFVPQVGDFYQTFLSSPDVAATFRAVFTRRLANSGGWLTLLGLLTLTFAVLLKLIRDRQNEISTESVAIDVESHCENQIPGFSPTLSSIYARLSPSNIFTVLLVLFGALLVTFPEFLYLRDQFGWRMNTIFKFYFQAWLLWSVAAAYASAYLLRTLRRTRGVIFTIGFITVLGMSLVYPVLSLPSKTNNFQPGVFTLDSTAYFENQSPDEMAAIRWLQSAAAGVVAEAVPPEGGSYTGSARVATLSGQPTVLGWYGHESQWRGGGELLAPRQSDLIRLYCSRDWSETELIIRKYNIRYVFVGGLERSVYRPGDSNCPVGLVEAKFIRNLYPVFNQGNVTIYEFNQID